MLHLLSEEHLPSAQEDGGLVDLYTVQLGQSALALAVKQTPLESSSELPPGVQCDPS